MREKSVWGGGGGGRSGMQSSRIKKLFYNILKRQIDSANTNGSY
jgi:hypothetical protein